MYVLYIKTVFVFQTKQEAKRLLPFRSKMAANCYLEINKSSLSQWTHRK